MANNYKTDQGKAPVVSAVFIPFHRTLLAIAEMMERQAIRHKLQGAKDPYQEWRQLPNGKIRLTDAGGRHAMVPWEINAKDRVGDHPGDLHILHAIWGLMAGYEKHLEERDAAEVPDYSDSPEQMAARGAPVPSCPNCHHPMTEHDCGFCYVPGCSCPVRQEAKPVHVPAGADWREKPPVCDAWANVDGTKRECRRDKDHKGLHEDIAGLRW